MLKVGSVLTCAKPLHRMAVRNIMQFGPRPGSYHCNWPALRGVLNEDANKVPGCLEIDFEKKSSSPTILYKYIWREVRRVLLEYDLDVPLPIVRRALRYRFYRNAEIKDQEVIKFLVTRAYMDLEEAVMLWGQDYHVMQFFKPMEYINMKLLDKNDPYQRDRLGHTNFHL